MELSGRYFSRDAVIVKIAAKTAQTILTIFGASVLVWLLVPLAPGDPAEKILHARGVENPRGAEIEAVRRELHLDEPLIKQYFFWLSRALTGDLSISYESGKLVSNEIAARLPASALLAATAFSMAIILAVFGACLGAFYYEKTPDRLILFATQAGAATPSFLLGLLLILSFVLWFGLGKVISSSSLADVWLPAFCLAIGKAASWTQILRANLLEESNRRYVLVARARGASRLRILLRYALPNAFVPLFPLLGVGVASLFAGAGIVETVFSWDGVGSYAVRAVAARDLPVIQAYVIVATLIYIAASASADFAAALVDPRRRTERAG